MKTYEYVLSRPRWETTYVCVEAENEDAADMRVRELGWEDLAQMEWQSDGDAGSVEWDLMDSWDNEEEV